MTLSVRDWHCVRESPGDEYCKDEPEWGNRMTMFRAWNVELCVNTRLEHAISVMILKSDVHCLDTCTQSLLGDALISSRPASHVFHVVKLPPMHVTVSSLSFPPQPDRSNSLLQCLGSRQNVALLQYLELASCSQIECKCPDTWHELPPASSACLL